MKTKIALLLVFLVICVGTGYIINNINEANYTRELQEIKSSRSTDLDNYRRNKQLAEDYLDVYKIVDENSYQQIKNELYNKLSTNMQNDIFPSVNYEGLPLHRMETSVLRCIGTNNSSGSNTFLIEFNLTGINYNQDVTTLVTIRDGVITEVERLK